MAKHRKKTTLADGSDPYSAQRYMSGRKSHSGARHRGMGTGWAIVIVGLFVMAVVVLVIN
jgi:hypothetical protein